MSNYLFIVLLITNSCLGYTDTQKDSGILKGYPQIKEVLNYVVNKQFKPTTLFVKNYESSSMLFDWNLVTPWPRLFGLERPLHPTFDNRRTNKRGLPERHEKLRYIYFVWLFEPKKLTELEEELKYNFHNRYDRLILIGPEHILRKAWSLSICQDLRWRIGIVWESGALWVDPKVYNGGNMLVLKRISENLKPLSPMGVRVHGRHFVFAASEFPPHNFVTDTDSKGNVVMDGTNLRTVTAASKVFNFTYEMQFHGPNYGRLEKNGTWSGAASGPIYHKAHLMFTSCQTYKWDYGIDFVGITSQSYLRFVTRQPIMDLPWNSFMLPYSMIVWIFIVTTFMVLGVVQGIVMWLYMGRRWTYRVWDAATFLPYSMAMEQGLVDIPKGVRYLSLLWLLTCTVLGTGYRSTLRTNLCFPSPEQIPRDVSSLASRTDYFSILYAEGIIEIAYFKDLPTPNSRAIKRNNMKEADSVTDCLNEALLTPHSTCIYWSPFIRAHIARDFTLNSRVAPLVEASDELYRVHQSFGFARWSPYADSFLGIVSGVKETHIWEKWQEDILYNFKKQGIAKNRQKVGTPMYHELKRVEGDSQTEKPLTWMNLYVVFAFLPIGACISGVLFGIEQMYWTNTDGHGHIFLNSSSKPNGNKSNQPGLPSPGVRASTIATPPPPYPGDTVDHTHTYNEQQFMPNPCPEEDIAINNSPHTPV